MPEFVSTIVVMHDRLPLNEWLVHSYVETTAGMDRHELICVDNGSKDGTRKFLQAQLKAGHVARMLLKDNNVFLGPAWNEAATKTIDPATNLIGKVDNDSYFKPGWLEEVRRVARVSKAGAVICTNARADWRAIYRFRGTVAMESAIKQSTTKDGWLIRSKDYGGNFYVRAKYVRAGLRMPNIPKMTTNSNCIFLGALKRRGGSVVRLVPGFMTWEKVRYTDPQCGKYYDRTYGVRGLGGMLRSRRKAETARIAKGEIKLEYLNE